MQQDLGKSSRMNFYLFLVRFESLHESYMRSRKQRTAISREGRREGRRAEVMWKQLAVMQVVNNRMCRVRSVLQPQSNSNLFVSSSMLSWACNSKYSRVQKEGSGNQRRVRAHEALPESPEQV